VDKAHLSGDSRQFGHLIPCRMAYDRSYLYLRIMGHFGTLTTFSDGWSVGLKLANSSGAEAPTAGFGGFLTGIKTAVQTFHQSAATFVGNAAYLDQLTLARVGADGRYNPEAQDTVFELYSPALPGAGTTINPWSTALVSSLRTPRPRGVASNGRFYYPAGTVAVVNTTGRMSSANVTPYVTAAKVLFDAINAQGAALSPAVKIHVMSQKGAGVSANVISVRNDGRIDQQERRENNTPSTWTSASLV